MRIAPEITLYTKKMAAAPAKAKNISFCVIGIAGKTIPPTGGYDLLTN